MTCSGVSWRSGCPTRPSGERTTGDPMELKHAVAMAMTIAACLASSGCESELKKAEVTVAQIADLLPGHYTNSAQVEADAKAGRVKHEPKSIDTVRLDLPLLSHHAFYAQENSLDEM